MRCTLLLALATLVSATSGHAAGARLSGSAIDCAYSATEPDARERIGAAILAGLDPADANASGEQAYVAAVSRACGIEYRWSQAKRQAAYLHATSRMGREAAAARLAAAAVALPPLEQLAAAVPDPLPADAELLAQARAAGVVLADAEAEQAALQWLRLTRLQATADRAFAAP